MPTPQPTGAQLLRDSETPLDNSWQSAQLNIPGSNRPGMPTQPPTESPRSQWGSKGGLFGQVLNYLRSSGKAPNVQVGDPMRYPADQISSTSNAQQRSGLSVNKPLPSQAGVRTRTSDPARNVTMGSDRGFYNEHPNQQITTKMRTSK